MARTGPPAHQLSWARISLTADLAQLGWEWEGPRALKPQAAHLGDPSGKPGKEPSPGPNQGLEVSLTTPTGTFPGERSTQP